MGHRRGARSGRPDSRNRITYLLHDPPERLRSGDRLVRNRPSRFTAPTSSDAGLEDRG
jgi:hypothetical protein